MYGVVLFLVALLVSSPAMAQTTITTIQPGGSGGQVIYLNGGQNGYRPTGDVGYDLGRAAGYASNGGRPQNRVTILNGNGSGNSGGAVQSNSDGINIYDNGNLTGTYSGGHFTPALPLQ